MRISKKETAKIIKNFREEYNLSQKELGIILKTPTNTITGWEQCLSRAPGLLIVALRTIRKEISEKRTMFL